MAIETRLAEDGDAAAIAHIYNQGIEDRIATFETEPRTIEERLGVIQASRGHFPIVVAVDDGAVLGWASTSQYSTRPCYSGIAEFSIYVAREARGRGIGRALLAALIDEADRTGFWKITSRVFPDNGGSRALCRALGFREVGVHEKHAKLDGVWRDVVIVERLIESNLV